MHIDSIQNGLVLDHITADKSMEIYRSLGLDELSCSVAIIKNVKSAKTGRKDILKIDADIELDLGVLGYLDPGITVNRIADGKIVEKKHLELPERVVNIIRCKNPRCITSVEPELDQVFELANRQTGEYRCLYCEEKHE